VKKISLKIRYLKSLDKQKSLDIQMGSSIYFMGICGTAMASLAIYLKRQGFFVSGSDENIYPPMSLKLKKEGISLFKYDRDNIKTSFSLIIVGNVISSSHVEIAKAKQLNIPVISFPEFLQQNLLSQTKNIVVAGTHGKSTSSSLMAWVLKKSYQNPSFFVGGIPNNFNSSLRVRDSKYFVIEGDEYDTSFFAKHAKFFHYNPNYVLLTGVEFDHADIYKDLADIKKTFSQFIKQIPSQGCLVAYADNLVVRELLSSCSAPVLTYGVKYGDFKIKNRILKKNLQIVEVFSKNQKTYQIEIPLLGIHNALNSLGVFILAKYLKWEEEKILGALKSFKGLKKRLEFKFEFQKAKIFEDFAHHPTAIQMGLSALKERYVKQRLLLVFEPQSFTACSHFFQKQYISSFEKADLIFIAKPYKISKVLKQKRLSVETLVKDLKQKKKEAFYYSDFKILEKDLRKHIKENDIVVFMSSGSCGHILDRLKKT